MAQNDPSNDYPVIHTETTEHYVPPHEAQENPPVQRRKKGSKKKPKASRHIELMEWLPTLPQLFAYMGCTQFLLMFWVFIAECANDVGSVWSLVLMWISVAVTTGLFLVYNIFLIKHNCLKSLTATIFAFVAFVFIFLLPVADSYTSKTKRSGRAVLFFFRMLVLGIVLAIYCIAYIEDVMGVRDNEKEGGNEAYKNKETN